MITRLTLRNFKSIEQQTYDFSKFDLLVGRNNTGKSTVLQALAIWQYCVEEFRRAKRSGHSGMQVVLPNFTALPVPEFNLLWRERTERRYPEDANGRKKQEYILIEIEVTWTTAKFAERKFAVRLRYNSPQAIYAIPAQGWQRFRELENEQSLPVIAFVPPFSGLEPTEEWRDDGPLRKQVGKAQPGSVLRNLLLRVCPPPARDQSVRPGKDYQLPPDWIEIKTVIRRWFSVDLKEPRYERGVDTQIHCEYQQERKLYDIISGGSGFHQALTLLAFLYGYKPSTILLDEPDAHLHVSLQRELLDYFKEKSMQRNIQFLTATHAEEFAKGVEASQIVSLLNRQAPKRVQDVSQVLVAMADVSNTELTQLMASPVMLYVEGESDERILRAWAKSCGAEESIAKVCFRAMGGGDKKLMIADADRHFEGARQIVPDARRLVLVDYDTEKTFHPDPSKPVLYEWGRRSIENYMLVPDAWLRAALRHLNVSDDLFAEPIRKLIYDYYGSQNLTLPRGQAWRDLRAEIFRVVNGKQLLFDRQDSLFNRLRSHVPPVELIRERIALAMTADELHEDVHAFFARLRAATG